MQDERLPQITVVLRGVTPCNLVEDHWILWESCCFQQQRTNNTGSSKGRRYSPARGTIPFTPRVLRIFLVPWTTLSVIWQKCCDADSLFN